MNIKIALQFLLFRLVYIVVNSYMIMTFLQSLRETESAIGPLETSLNWILGTMIRTHYFDLHTHG
jgi:hypothetical protein